MHVELDPPGQATPRRRQVRAWLLSAAVVLLLTASVAVVVLLRFPALPMGWTKDPALVLDLASLGGERHARAAHARLRKLGRLEESDAPLYRRHLLMRGASGRAALYRVLAQEWILVRQVLDLGEAEVATRLRADRVSDQEDLRSACRAACAALTDWPDASLRWLQARQDTTGSWPAATAPIMPAAHPPIAVETTAWALLCYLGAGYDHRMPSKYKQVVRAGIDRLLRTRDAASGRFDADPRSHAVATIAVAEAYAMSNDPALKARGQAAIAAVGEDLAVRRSMAWEEQTDLAMLGVMAHKSAAAAGLSVGNRFEESRTALRALLARVAAADPTPSWFHAGVAVPGLDDDAAACVVLGAVFTGLHGDAGFARLVDRLAALDMGGMNEFTRYASALTLFQAGRMEPLHRLWEANRVHLVDDFGNDHGSRLGRTSELGDRVMATALGTLVTEIRYRYRPSGAP